MRPGSAPPIRVDFRRPGVCVVSRLDRPLPCIGMTRRCRRTSAIAPRGSISTETGDGSCAARSGACSVSIRRESGEVSFCLRRARQASTRQQAAGARRSTWRTRTARLDRCRAGGRQVGVDLRTHSIDTGHRRDRQPSFAPRRARWRLRAGCPAGSGFRCWTRRGSVCEAIGVGLARPSTVGDVRGGRARRAV